MRNLFMKCFRCLNTPLCDSHHELKLDSLRCCQWFISCCSRLVAESVGCQYWRVAADTAAATENMSSVSNLSLSDYLLLTGPPASSSVYKEELADLMRLSSGLGTSILCTGRWFCLKIDGVHATSRTEYTREYCHTLQYCEGETEASVNQSNWINHPISRHFSVQLCKITEMHLHFVVNKLAKSRPPYVRGTCCAGTVSFLSVTCHCVCKKSRFPLIITVRRYALHGICYRNSVRLSVCHTRGLCSHGLTYDHDFFTVW